MAESGAVHNPILYPFTNYFQRFYYFSNTGSKSCNGFYSHWLSDIKFALLYYHLVPEVSYDLTRITAQLFESCMSTNSIIRAY